MARQTGAGSKKRKESVLEDEDDRRRRTPLQHLPTTKRHRSGSWGFSRNKTMHCLTSKSDSQVLMRALPVSSAKNVTGQERIQEDATMDGSFQVGLNLGTGSLWKLWQSREKENRLKNNSVTGKKIESRDWASCARVVSNFVVNIIKYSSSTLAKTSSPTPDSSFVRQITA